MMDLLSLLNTIHRPRLLIRAARIGVDDYRRDIHLRRILGLGTLPRSGAALAQLIEAEAEINEQRDDDTAGYSPARHVEILIAMMGEAQLLRASTRIEISPA
ncbi:DUF6477 family protein [Thalassovita sp.]|uniref:DUF6477 family protein n=1 Tax=Thalassovita sp. TaxID=1979401 RepID=UPI002881DBF2|nr:DUF6477 family protein [Thalassovita sp.]MDF1801427.1 DUF6477 family protein [Thalassovita sp.]